MNHFHPKQISAGRRVRERGSALLVVFVFAAIIAILLYRELPVVLFEAKRQKEELLVDRGHEYVRAIQLFYRRNRGQYPASIDQLENTNNVRYLRRRYKDPFTGKDDWRLLHAGPGGMLIDSKVNRGLTGVPGMPGSAGNGTNTNGFGQSASGQASAGQSGFSQSSFSQSSFSSSGTSGNGSSDAEVVVPDVPQRGPAIPASAGGQAGVPSSADLAQNPDTPLLPPANDGQNGPTAGGGANPPNPPGTNGQQGNGRTGQSNPMQLMNPMLTSPSATNPQGQGGAFPSGNGSAGQGFGQPGQGFGQAIGGALAGVASKATGHSIKAVEDQRDYAKWEFYYDPSKDRGISGGQQIGGSQNGSGFGQNGSTGSPGVTSQPTSSGFGSQSTSSGFGSQPTSSSFGSQSPSTAPPPSQTPSNPNTQQPQ